MSLRKITESDLQGYGVVGMEDTPNLSARAMQEKVEEVVRKVVIPAINENVEKTVSKQDLADAVFNAGAGDMQAANYDSNLDGIVNKADNGFFTYTHSKVGNIHYLYGNGSNIKFVSTAAFEDGDVFMIGESYYPAFLIDGDSLPGGFFKEDMVVSCFVHGNCLNFKRGGAGLNFKIVGGTTQPASPTENTLWVNTDLGITGWAFDSQAPDYLGTGGVWIKTGNSSTGEFNAVKKNAVNVYPNACYQWDGNQFVSKTALIYLNGAWINFGKVYLYNSGDLCSDITGGWNFVTSYICNKQSTYLQIGRDSQAYTVNAIDLTDAKSIHFLFNSIPSPDNTPTLAVATSGTTTSFAASVGGTTYKENTYNVEYTLDVSALTGDYYVILRNQGWADIQALQVWLEY